MVVVASLAPASANGSGESHGVAATEAEAPEPTAVDYCANFADAANDARTAWQAANLKILQGELEAKIAELEARQAELQQWIVKRDAMLKKAGKELVDIYAKMDPEAAAQQLAQLDTGTATSVIRQLPPRGASAILNVMEAKQAAKLARAIANATLDAGKDGGT
jgi:flagellar motility protein MotE (MotC chaperone)